MPAPSARRGLAKAVVALVAMTFFFRGPYRFPSPDISHRFTFNSNTVRPHNPRPR
jgi:hypothetical protein